MDPADLGERFQPGALASARLLFVYVLTGWMSFHYQGHGEHRLKAGGCHIIPPGLSHTVTGWSEDVELLEVTAPSHYKTIDTVNGVEVVPASA